jgi:hypothetical protein
MASPGSKAHLFYAVSSSIFFHETYACCMFHRQATQALRMGYLDEISPTANAQQGLDASGKHVMPSVEEFYKVMYLCSGSHLAAFFAEISPVPSCSHLSENTKQEFVDAESGFDGGDGQVRRHQFSASERHCHDAEQSVCVALRCQRQLCPRFWSDTFTNPVNCQFFLRSRIFHTFWD